MDKKESDGGRTETALLHSLVLLLVRRERFVLRKRPPKILLDLPLRPLERLGLLRPRRRERLLQLQTITRGVMLDIYQGKPH